MEKALPPYCLSIKSLETLLFPNLWWEVGGYIELEFWWNDGRFLRSLAEGIETKGISWFW